MEKKFLDKKGLAEFCNSFKDKFASKSDLEPVSNFMSKMSFEEQKQYWIKQIESYNVFDVFNYMLLRGKYCPQMTLELDSNCTVNTNHFTNEEQAKMFVYMENTMHQMTVETSYDEDSKIHQLAYNSSRSVIASRTGIFAESIPSDKDLIDILNQSKNVLSLQNHFEITWSKWLVEFTLDAIDLPFLPYRSKPCGLLSKEDKQKLDNMSTEGNTVHVVDSLYHQDTKNALSANQGYILNNTKVDKVDGKQLSSNDYTNEDKQKLMEIPKCVFLEKEQYANFSEKEKMDNTKLYYIYAERPQ